MNTDIVDLREFYHSPLGRSAEQAITMALSTLWPSLPDERLVGLGYAVPFLDRFRHDTERTFAFMPAGQGAVNWPAGELSSTALVFDEELPLPEATSLSLCGAVVSREELIATVAGMADQVEDHACVLYRQRGNSGKRADIGNGTTGSRDHSKGTAKAVGYARRYGPPAMP